MRGKFFLAFGKNALLLYTSVWLQSQDFIKHRFNTLLLNAIKALVHIFVSVLEKKLVITWSYKIVVPLPTNDHIVKVCTVFAFVFL